MGAQVGTQGTEGDWSGCRCLPQQAPTPPTAAQLGGQQAVGNGLRGDGLHGTPP